jgi:hypothetical protein
MTIKTNDLIDTMAYVSDLAQRYDDNDTKVGIKNSWANERKIILTLGGLTKTYEIELSLGRDDHPLVAAAKIVADWKGVRYDQAFEEQEEQAEA